MIHFGSSSAAFSSLALCAIPLIIYLIFRRRRRDIAWGAIYILRRLLEQRRKTSAWKQYVIIALRTLAFLALALAFPRPFLRPRSDGSLPRPPVSTHRVLLVDVSPSMDAAHGGGTVMDTALGFCRQALDRAVSPGQLDIVPMDGGDTSFSFRSAPVREEEMERLLGGMPRSPAPADFEQGLERAIRIFRSSGYAFKELYILSDFSHAAIGSPERLAGLFETLRAFDVSSYAMAWTKPDALNVALHAFTPHLDVILAGQPTLFTLELGYYGAAPETEAGLFIRDANGRELFADTLRLAPGKRAMAIPLTLSAGEHLLTASVGEDDYQPDNSATIRIRATPSLRITVLQDLTLESGLTNPREWLKIALAAGDPSATVSGSGTRPASDTPRWDVDFATIVQAGTGLFEGRDGVVFLDVDRADPDVLEAARGYVLRGGTILLAPGPTADPERFNETFASLRPARIGAPRPETLDPEIYSGALLDRPEQALLAELDAVEHGNIGNARFYRAYEVRREDLAEDADVWFSLSDGSPLCVFRPMGRGGVLLWTAGLGMDWHSMVVHPAYPVFLTRMFTMAAARRHFAVNLKPGEPFIAKVERARARLFPPDGGDRDIEAIEVAGSRWLRVEDTLKPGVYRLREEGGDEAEDRVFTVSDARTESDYRPISGQDRTSLERMMGAGLFESEAALAASLAAHYPGRSLMSYAALLMMGLLVLEAGLARRWFT